MSDIGRDGWPTADSVLRGVRAELEKIKAERDALRNSFQLETLRTSECYRLLSEWIAAHEAEHSPGPWSRDCIRCDLVGRSKTLMAKPINADSELDALRKALTAIVANPHGCRFCDSGKLRNPNKPHDDTCGFALAAAIAAAKK